MLIKRFHRENSLQLEVSNIDKMACQCRSSCHGGRDQMGAAPCALSALEVAIRCRGAALTGLKPIGIHCKTHRAAWLAPLKAGLPKDLIEAFLLCLGLDQSGSGHHQREFHTAGFFTASDDGCR